MTLPPSASPSQLRRSEDVVALTTRPGSHTLSPLSTRAGFRALGCSRLSVSYSSFVLSLYLDGKAVRQFEDIPPSKGFANEPL